MAQPSVFGVGGIMEALEAIEGVEEVDALEEVDCTHDQVLPPPPPPPPPETVLDTKVRRVTDHLENCQIDVNIDPLWAPMIVEVCAVPAGRMTEPNFCNKKKKEFEGQLTTAQQRFEIVMTEIEEAKRNVGGSLILNEGWHGVTAASYLETAMPQSSTAHLEFLQTYVTKIKQAHDMHGDYRVKRMKAMIWEARRDIEIQLDNEKRHFNLTTEGGTNRLMRSVPQNRGARLGAGGAFDASQPALGPAP